MTTDDANFILPKTEQTVSRILETLCSFFATVTICTQGLYAAYLVGRLIFSRELFVLRLMLCVIAAAAFALSVYQKCAKRKLGAVPARILYVLGLVVRFVMLASIFYGIVIAPDRYSAWNIIAVMLMIPAWFLSAGGAVFCAVVPRWTEQLVASFKADIELRGLAGRSLEQAGKAAKEALFESGGKKVAAAAAVAIPVALPLLKKLFGKREQQPKQ